MFSSVVTKQVKLRSLKLLMILIGGLKGDKKTAFIKAIEDLSCGVLITATESDDR